MICAQPILHLPFACSQQQKNKYTILSNDEDALK